MGSVNLFINSVHHAVDSTRITHVRYHVILPVNECVNMLTVEVHVHRVITSSEHTLRTHTHTPCPVSTHRDRGAAGPLTLEVRTHREECMQLTTEVSSRTLPRKRSAETFHETNAFHKQ